MNWSAVPHDGPDEWVERLLGHEWAEKVSYHEEHHDDGQFQLLKGTVRSIREVTCSRTPEVQGSGEVVLVPISGSGILRELPVADKWSPEPPDDLRGQMTFDGWIVELELAP